MSQSIVMKSVAELLACVPEPDRHPGLALDKFSPSGKQDAQKEALATICKASGDQAVLTSLSELRRKTVLAEPAESWSASTAGPLTLHLSRANALENAGIALHPLYGFAYLPSSGLKGAARAYAETIWLPAQPDAKVGERDIVGVFGCAPRSDEEKAWLSTERREAENAQAGAVVFHDAWPKTWPKLLVDIAAIHHPKYYQAVEGSVPPPGDWETPTLISFLAIAPGTEFCFAVAPCGAGRDGSARLLGLARQWLNGALTTLGVGAKTAAGYGLFTVPGFTPAKLPPTRLSASYDLTLVTPAFLAGSAQAAEDCDLRGATLRGQLRWWWRTMHAAHLEPRLLRRLEAAIWGTSSEGSAVQIRVSRADGLQCEQMIYKGRVERSGDSEADRIKNREIKKVNDDFLTSNGISLATAHKTTDGLYYYGYGLGEDNNTKPKKAERFFRQPGSVWKVGLLVRASHFAEHPNESREARVLKPIPADTVLQQVKAALFLLTRFGGVGAKARKGFGSFADVNIDGIADIDSCKRIAEALRTQLGLKPHEQSDTPALKRMSDPVVVETKWTNAWFALNRIGEAMQGYAKTGKHEAWKAALGLPRKSDHSSAVQVKRDSKEKMLQPWATLPILGKIRLERHAAPIHFHVAKAGDRLTVRLVTFVSKHLPDELTSPDKLDALRRNVQDALNDWKDYGGTAQLSPKPREIAVPVDDGRLRVGSKVKAVLLEEKTKNGGWKAKHIPSGQVGSIMNTKAVPGDKTHGEIVELEVHSASEFKWPVPKVQPAPPPRHGAPKGRR